MCVVNLKFDTGAINNIELHAQAAYGYDAPTEIIGSQGSILVESFKPDAKPTFVTAHRRSRAPS